MPNDDTRIESLGAMVRELIAARKVVEATRNTLDVNEWASIAVALREYDEGTK